MSVLGCGQYRAVLRETGEDGQKGPVIEEFDNLTSIKWQRSLNRRTTGSVTVAGDCCGPTAEWLNTSYCDPGEMSLERTPEGNEVHVGPLISPEFGDETATLTWSDQTWWLGTRALAPFDTGTAPADVSTVLEDIYQAAFQDADPAVWNDGGFLQGTSVGSFVDPVTDGYRLADSQLSQLVSEGLDWTQYVRGLRYGPDIPTEDALSGIRLPKISDDDVVGELKFKRRWDLAASRVIVQGANGVLAIAEDGLCPARLRKDHIISDPDLTQQEAQAVADKELELRSPAPLTITMGRGTQLRPDAPICIDDLIPGALVQVCSANACFAETQIMRLTAVDVTATPGEEQVRLAFATPGSGGLNLGFEDEFADLGRLLKTQSNRIADLERQLATR